MKHTSKRILALVLSLACLLPMLGIVASAYEVDLPIVYVAGKYSTIYSADDTRQLYQLDPLLSVTIKENASKLVAAYNTSNTTGNWKYFADSIYDTVAPRYAELVLNGNGEVTNGTHIHPSEAPKKKTSNFYLHDYMFYYDSRLDPYVNAANLNDYINQVLAATGKTKVNIIGRCIGTCIVMTYLTVYGCSKVNATIFYAPAVNGVFPMSSYFTGNFYFDYNNFTYYLDNNFDDEGGGSETIRAIYDALNGIGLFALGLRTANEVWAKTAPYLLQRLILATIGTWPGHWTMIGSQYEYKNSTLGDKPNEVYEKAKTLIFAGKTAEYAGLIKKIDKYHYNVNNKISETLENCMKRGMNFAIVAKYNTPLMPLSDRSKIQADGTVELRSMSFGATAADIGTTLSASYIRAAKNARGDKYVSKYLSADGVIDASTCDYPEQTWFIRDVGHAEYPSEINQLFLCIFRSKSQYTVRSNSKYPQFVKYDSANDKISPITEADKPTNTDDGSGGGSNISDFFKKISDYIINLAIRVMEFLGLK